MEAPGFKTMPIVKQKRDRLAALRNERASFIDHWRDLSDHILPRRARFFTTDRNKGTKRNDKIIDSTATLAARTLSSGMMAGLTSPARPWFRLLPHNLELLEDGAVREWLWAVEGIMRDVFTRSNLYDALPLVYTDLGVFGTAALQIVEDADDVIRAHTLPVGSYMVASDYAGRVCTLYREYQMTVGNLVEKYGKDRVTASTKNLWDAGKVDAWVEVVDAIEKNIDHNPRYADAALKAWKLVCFEASGSDDDQPLEESGFDEFPCMVTRWSVTGEDIYGHSPAFDALPDVRQLQLMQKRKLLAIEKMVNPPMMLSPELENKNFSILPGALNYGRSMSASPAAMPAHPLNLPLNWLLEDITQVQERVRRAFYEDLFLMLSLSDRRNITAREVDERHEEKLLQLGPVLERVNDELLDPLIDRVFAILLRRGMIPEPPETIAGSELRVEYVSIMAQAQKVVHTASVDKFLSFVGAVAGLDPGVIDMVDFDEAVEDYGDQLGISPKLILSSEEVAAKRAARAKAEQAAKTQQTMFAMADAAQKMGNTPMDGDTALTRVMDAAGPALAAQGGAVPA